jgi:hypothetical protein
VFDSVRGVLYLAGVGVVFAVLDGLRPRDWGFFQHVLGVFNTLTMLGAFMLARRLSSSSAAGIVTLALGLVYPTFSVETGRLYPDPLTACLFVWAAVLYLQALHRSSARRMAAAGLLFTAGLLVRSQLMNYMLIVIGLVLAFSAPVWARRRESRRLAAAFALSCLPALVGWAGIVRAVGPRDDVAQLGNVTFRPPYPYGFWRFLETDGWIGPYNFKAEPYYKAMEAAARSDPQLMRSRARQIAFTVRYVARRPWESLLLVLDNAYRLYDRPANDYKWDYPIPYSWQVALQRVVMVLALTGMAIFTARRPAVGGVFIVPLALAVLHGLVFPLPRYNVTVMPILLAAAGAAAVSLAGSLRAEPQETSAPVAQRALRSPVLRLIAGGLALVVLARLVFPRLPEAARIIRDLGWLSALGAPFLLAAQRAVPSPRGRRLAAAAWVALAVVFGAHAVRDRSWHEVLTRVGGGGGVEQEIVLGPEALGAVRAASEALLVFDLRVPRGDLSRTTLQVGDQALSGSSLLPTMPRLRESTATGGRDWRGYPQWWALPLDPRRLPERGEPLRIRLVHGGSEPLVLGADRFRREQRVYEGPSFGDWPHAVALKLEYDGDYRVPVELPLGSVSTRSFVLDAQGGRRPAPAVHRIRLLTLRSNEGWLDWESAPLPRARNVGLAFAAWSGQRGEAQLFAAAAAPFSFPLGARRDFDVAAGAVRLCQRAEGERGEKAYGSYLLLGPTAAVAGPGAFAVGQPVRFHLRFRTGMSQQPMFFVIDRGRPERETAAQGARCDAPPGTALVDGAARVLDAAHNNYPEDTGRWAVDRVF